MRRTTEQVHQDGGHADVKRPRCSMCVRPKPDFVQVSNRPSVALKPYRIEYGRGYCTPAGIR